MIFDRFSIDIYFRATTPILREVGSSWPASDSYSHHRPLQKLSKVDNTLNPSKKLLNSRSRVTMNIGRSLAVPLSPLASRHCRHRPSLSCLFMIQDQFLYHRLKVRSKLSPKPKWEWRSSLLPKRSSSRVYGAPNPTGSPAVTKDIAFRRKRRRSWN